MASPCCAAAPPWFEPGEHALVTDLDVAAEFRRRGLGEAVLAGLCAWARDRRLERVEAELVTANKVAVGFWRRRGFAPYYQAVSRPL